MFAFTVSTIWETRQIYFVSSLLQGLLCVRTYVRYLITRPRANSIKKLRYLKNNAKNYREDLLEDGLRARYRLHAGRVCGACARATSTRSSLFGPVQSRHSGTDISASFLKIDFPLLTPKTPCIVLTTGVVVSDVQYGRASIVSKHHTLQDPFVVL